MNELAFLSKDLDVDLWEAIGAASTKPYGFMPFWPGPGVGGHCIAIDPSYLSWRVGQRTGHRLTFVEHAQEVNAKMPGFVAHRGQLNQSFVTDVTWRSAIGGGSGEAFSLRFDGQGVVYIQPEER